MTLGQNFPVSEYYREHIISGRTIVRSGSWWSAVLLIEDPRTKKPFVALYKWQWYEGKWKARSKFNIRSTQELTQLSETFAEFGPNLK